MDPLLLLPNGDRLIAFALVALPRIVAALVVLLLFWLGLKPGNVVR